MTCTKNDMGLILMQRKFYHVYPDDRWVEGLVSILEGNSSPEPFGPLFLSMVPGYQPQDENRVLTREEAYEQLIHGVSPFKAILE